MRAAEARTEVLQPASRPSRLRQGPSSPSRCRLNRSGRHPCRLAPRASCQRCPLSRSPRTWSGWTRPPCCASSWPTSSTRPAARQDVRVSVGVGGGSAVEWVLRDAVPYGVRALPRYPAETAIGDPAAALEAVGAALADDAPSGPERRRLVVLVWGRPPDPVRLPAALASALVLHCVDVGARLASRRTGRHRPGCWRGHGPGPVAPCWPMPAVCSPAGRRSPRCLTAWC